MAALVVILLWTTGANRRGWSMSTSYVWWRVLANPILRREIEAAQLEQPQWEATIPLDVLASAPFPKLVVSGGWSRAFVPRQGEGLTQPVQQC
jgi:hypothetical protein